MLARLRSKLTYANIMATVAVFLALGGAAYAAATVGSAQVINDSLRSVDLKDGAAVRSPDVVDNSLTGADIASSTLGTVPNANHASSADSASFASTAGDANQLGGFPASAYNKGCDAGALNGIVQVVGGSGFSSTFTTSGVTSYNCVAGQTVQARRVSVGKYHVRFNGNGSTYAVGTVDSSSNGGSGVDDFVSVADVNDGGQTFEVNIRDADGGAEDATFTLVVP